MQDRRVQLHQNNVSPILLLGVGNVKCGTAILINGINTV